MLSQITAKLIHVINDVRLRRSLGISICVYFASTHLGIAQSISGMVVNSITSDTIGNIVLHLSGIVDGQVVDYMTKSKSNGEFTFLNVSPSKGYWLYAPSQANYSTAYFRGNESSGLGVQFPLKDQQQLDGLLVQMVPTGKIEGRVLDKSGKPIKGVPVSALTRSFQNGAQILKRSSGTINTDSRGHYLLSGLTPGVYYVCMNCVEAAADFRFDGNDPSIINPLSRLQLSMKTQRPIPQYYHSESVANQATPVYVKAGITVGEIDLIKGTTRRSRIRGVAIYNGKSAGYTGFLLLKAGAVPGAPPDYAYLSIDGTFDLGGIVPGDYIISATTRGVQPSLNGRLALSVKDTDISNLQIPLTQGFDLRGKVVVDGAPESVLPNVFVTLRPKPPSLSDLLPLPSVVTPKFSGNSVGTGVSTVLQIPAVSSGLVNGELRFSRVNPWDYRIEVSGLPANYFIKTIRLGELDVLKEGLAMSTPLDQLLEIMLSPSGGEIQGQVRDKENHLVAGAIVVLVPNADRAARHDLFKVVASDQSGSFNFTAIPPADYKLFAWRYIEPGTWLDADKLSLYESKAQFVHMIEGGHEKVELPAMELWR